MFIETKSYLPERSFRSAMLGRIGRNISLLEGANRWVGHEVYKHVTPNVVLIRCPHHNPLFGSGTVSINCFTT